MMEFVNAAYKVTLRNVYMHSFILLNEVVAVIYIILLHIHFVVAYTLSI